MCPSHNQSRNFLGTGQRADEQLWRTLPAHAACIVMPSPPGLGRGALEGLSLLGRRRRGLPSPDWGWAARCSPCSLAAFLQALAGLLVCSQSQIPGLYDQGDTLNWRDQPHDGGERCADTQAGCLLWTAGGRGCPRLRLPLPWPRAT